MRLIFCACTSENDPPSTARLRIARMTSRWLKLWPPFVPRRFFLDDPAPCYRATIIPSCCGSQIDRGGQ